MKYFPSLLIVLFALPVVYAQDALRGSDATAYNEMKSQRKPVVVDGDSKATADNRSILTKQAKFMVRRLMDAKPDEIGVVIRDAINQELPIKSNRPRKIDEPYLDFAREMGDILVKELEPAVKSSKLHVSLNAARMLSVVAQLGCARSAELALKVLEDPQINEGVKFWALRTLTEIFMFEPDSALPEQSVFQVKDRDKKDLRELERRAIVFLCNYVLASRDTAGKAPDEVAAIRYLRREATRALGFVRTHRVRLDGKTLASPGWVLLKVANKDGIEPPPEPKEQSDAVVGFCQLFPVIRANVDRDIQNDFAANLIGFAILDIFSSQIQGNTADKSAPWIQTAARIDHGLNTWSSNVGGMQLNGADAAKKLYEQAKAKILDAFREGQAANANAQAFRTWLQENPAKSKSLYSDEPNTVVKPVGGQ